MESAFRMDTLNKKGEFIMLNNRAFITEAETHAIIRYTKEAKADIVEIGTFAGGTAENAGQHTPKGLAWWAIDLFEDFTDSKNPVHVYKEYLMKHGCIFNIQGDSREMGKYWNKPIGFLFIDGSHYVDDVRRDFAAWSPWLIPGGIIAFHDAYGFNQGELSPKFPSLNGYDLIHERGPEGVVAEVVAEGEWSIVETVDTVVFMSRT